MLPLLCIRKRRTSPFKPSTFHDSYREKYRTSDAAETEGAENLRGSEAEKDIDSMEASKRSVAATSARGAQAKARKGAAKKSKRTAAQR
jgi:non-homologous end joining protein Ku